MRNLATSQETTKNNLLLFKQSQIETSKQEFLNKLELEEWPKIFLREHLHFWMRKYGLAVGPYKEIARRAEISERSVKRYMPELLKEGYYKRTLRKHKGSIIEIDFTFLMDEEIFKKLKVLKNVYRKKGCGTERGGSRGTLSGTLKNQPLAATDTPSQTSLARAQNISPSSNFYIYKNYKSIRSNTIEKSIKGDETSKTQQEKETCWSCMIRRCTKHVINRIEDLPSDNILSWSIELAQKSENVDCGQSSLVF